MFPAATVVTVARNVARRGVLVIFVSVFKFCKVSMRFLTVCQEARRRATVCHGWFYTFPSGLPRSVGTSHVLLRCDQVLLRLSSFVKVFYDETWAMNGVRAPICPRYKKEVHKAAEIVILCTIDQTHH